MLFMHVRMSNDIQNDCIIYILQLFSTKKIVTKLSHNKLVYKYTNVI